MGESSRYLRDITSGFKIYIVALFPEIKTEHYLEFDKHFDDFATGLGSHGLLVHITDLNEKIRISKKFKISNEDKWPVLIIFSENPNSLEKNDNFITMFLGDLPVDKIGPCINKILFSVMDTGNELSEYFYTASIQLSISSRK